MKVAKSMPKNKQAKTAFFFLASTLFLKKVRKSEKQFVKPNYI